MGRRGRPVHTPTEQTRTLVRRLSGFAVGQDDIAKFVEISDVTLRKYYSADLQRGCAEANLKVVQSLFRAATRENNPNVVAQMFWLKNRAGWKDMGIVATPADSVNLLTIEFVEPPAVPEASGVTIDGTAEPLTTAAPHDGGARGTEPTDGTEAVEFEIEFVAPEESAQAPETEPGAPQPEPEPLRGRSAAWMR